MKKNRISPWLSTVFFLLILSACQKTDQNFIMTVEGRLDPENMGLTLSHEHLLVDFIGADSTGYHRWNRDSVMDKMLPFLQQTSLHEVQTFIDATPAYLGRDPELLRRLSKSSGINIITNTGYYGARNNAAIPGEAFQMSAKELAAIWIDEYQNGIEGSQIKPGFIKIAVERSDTLSAFHKRLVTAAALTHKATGLAIASHTGPDAPAFAQMEILKSENVEMSSFIWVHAHNGSLEGNLKAAALGAWISLDNYNTRRDMKADTRFNTSWYVKRLQELKDAGELGKVLISHDAGWYRPGEPNGGEIRGYTEIFTSLIPALQEGGFTKDDIEQLLVKNPLNAFVIKK